MFDLKFASSRVEFDPSSSASSHRILTASENRECITFFPPAAGGVTLSNESGGTFGNGLTLMPGMAPVYLHVKKDGNVVQLEWYAVYSSFINPVSWIQALA